MLLTVQYHHQLLMSAIVCVCVLGRVCIFYVWQFTETCPCWRMAEPMNYFFHNFFSIAWQKLIILLGDDTESYSMVWQFLIHCSISMYRFLSTVLSLCSQKCIMKSCSCEKGDPHEQCFVRAVGWGSKKDMFHRQKPFCPWRRSSRSTTRSVCRTCQSSKSWLKYIVLFI